MSAFIDFPEHEKFPSYRTLSVTLAANEIYTINQVFDSFAVLELSGDIEMSLNEQSPSDFDAGIQMRAPVGKGFTSMRLQETAGAAANFRILLSFGDVRDSRANISGNVSVQNASAPNDELQIKMKTGTLPVDLDAADAGIAALIAALREDQLLRAPLTTLEGATYSERNNEASEQTIVSSGTNTAGIIVRKAFANTNTAATDAYFAINDGATKIFCGRGETGGNNFNFEGVENIHIPSGVALVSRFQGSSSYGRIWYEVLT